MLCILSDTVSLSNQVYVILPKHAAVALIIFIVKIFVLIWLSPFFLVFFFFDCIMNMLQGSSFHSLAAWNKILCSQHHFQKEMIHPFK